MKNLLIVLAIIFVSCKSPSDKKTETKSIELVRLQTSIDSLFNSEVEENESGAAILVSYDSEMIIGKGYGLRDIENNEPITTNTNMRMASVSKQFTALSVLSLVDKGLLSLNDSIKKIWPYHVFENITIQHLLNHTSGLADYEAPYFLKDWDKSKIVENKDILDWLSTNPKPIFEAGKGWEYSNTAYVVLANLVEKVSGKEFSIYAKKNVFEKAGMKEANYYNLANPIKIKERAYCYEKDSLGNWGKVDGNFMNGLMGDGSVYTSVEDYFEYDLALRKKSILSEETHDLIFKPSSTYQVNGEDRHYAMGWVVTDSTATHTGGWFGTNTFTKRYLNKPLTIAIFMNRNTLFENDLIKKTDSLVLEYVNTTTNNAYKK
ncbi:Beta-lactamase class C-like and penicillin binding proteins (PBPs) superfamily [hydrothermal vent metagenome]|uniref:Beta-lactamase class C-like and penicillin binding proteins (PBPs) superfamily n=1 Tax=hydrothermal vent metagenome TaxID=652676 RepID=A0A3B0RL72_9ZZZZ